MTRKFLITVKIYFVGAPYFFYYTLFLSYILSSLTAQASQSLEALKNDVPPIQLRVRIAQSVTHFSLRGFDLQFYLQTEKGWSMDHQVDQTSEWEVKCQKGEIQVHKQGNFSSSQIKRFHGPIAVSTPAGFLRYNDALYRNEIRIFQRGSQCDVVNVLALEKYLDGLVNAEFSANWSPEAISAQVVAARTYAYYQITQAKKDNTAYFDLDSTVKDQVYKGSLREHYHSAQAVERTKGLILTFLKSSSDLNHAVYPYPYPIKAFYHSTCGGLTQLPQHEWGQVALGYKRPVSCPFCAHSPRFHWDYLLPVEDLRSILLKAVQLHPEHWPNLNPAVLQKGMLLQLDLKKHKGGSSSRVKKVSTFWGFGPFKTELSLSGTQLREWVGFEKLKSTWFSVSYIRKPKTSWTLSHVIKKDKFLKDKKNNQSGTLKFKGQGFGHGVGMCQWGAKVMGEKSYSMNSILHFYYPDAILTKLW